jgi:putative transposase
MYSMTRFGELMKGLPRGSFEQAVATFGADKHSKGFRSWDQLLAMLYAQLSGSRSLRDLEAGFNSQAVHHYHLGTREIKRSTLADANNKRSSELFSWLCKRLFEQAHRKQKKELKDLLYLIDSTPIPLKGLGYDDWATAHRNDRTQGFKVHMALASNGAVPVYQQITEPNINDVEIGRQMPLERGATYVFDKGYCDYNWWYQIEQRGAFFVTRFKKNAGLETVEQRSLPKDETSLVLEDSHVRFKNQRPGGGRMNHYFGTFLRRVVIARPDKKTPLILATNDFERSAEEIADLYRQRWEIELFFKWLKQNLKIKKFLGRSENAVKVQIYTALIAYMLVQLYRERNGIKASLHLCLVILQSGLFQRPDTEEAVEQRRRKRRRDLDEIQEALPL